MVESLQMFLFLFKSKYRRKFSWFSPFLCSVLIVLLFCDGVLSRCSDHNCLNGVCNNETCVCYEGWQGAECQYCGGKVKWVSSDEEFPRQVLAIWSVHWPIWQARLGTKCWKQVRFCERKQAKDYPIMLFGFFSSSQARDEGRVRVRRRLKIERWHYDTCLVMLNLSRFYCCSFTEFAIILLQTLHIASLYSFFTDIILFEYFF